MEQNPWPTKLFQPLPAWTFSNLSLISEKFPLTAQPLALTAEPSSPELTQALFESSSDARLLLLSSMSVWSGVIMHWIGIRNHPVEAVIAT